MLVSVVIPAYNAEAWIAESIASVLRQTYQKIEIILVDDGSTDRTPEIATALLRAGSFPHRVFRQPNLGAAKARNKGWRDARGQWIQFLDADDLLEPHKIELQVARAHKDRRPDVIYSDWQKLLLRGKGWIAHDLRTPQIGGDALADLLSDRNFLQLGCLLIKASMLDLVGGFDSSHEPIEDVGMCVKIAIAGGVYAKVDSTGPVAYYRDLPRSFSKINHKKFIESCVKNAKLTERYIQQYPTESKKTVEAIVAIYFAAARFYAGLDWERFGELNADIMKLQPDFVPGSPRALNVLSRIIGYKRAEQLAVFYRRGKSIAMSLRPGQQG
jgi:glycosyltransferase involved in cell wall biosynthesis